MQCLVCRSENRGRIELALVAGASAKAVGLRFGVSRHALGRHLRAHVSQERRAQLVAGPLKLHELAERAAEADLALLDYLGLTRSIVVAQMLAAAEVGDRQGVALLAGRLTDILRLDAQVNGQLRPALSQINNTVNNNFHASPDYLRLKDELLAFGREHMEVFPALIAMIERLDAGNTAPAQALPAALEHRQELAP